MNCFDFVLFFLYKLNYICFFNDKTSIICMTFLVFINVNIFKFYLTLDHDIIIAISTFQFHSLKVPLNVNPFEIIE